MRGEGSWSRREGERRGEGKTGERREEKGEVMWPRRLSALNPPLVTTMFYDA